MKLCRWKGVGIIESEVCPDHINMLVEISLSQQYYGQSKDKSSLQTYERRGGAKFRYRTWSFGVKGTI